MYVHWKNILDPLMEQYHSLRSLLPRVEKVPGQSSEESAIQE